MLRVGHGYDVHRFAEGDHLCIGGVKIPYERGLQAHSDGDVLLHALCDAMLGALALGDIGSHFPDSDPAFAGVDSLVLLAEVNRRVNAKGYRLGNADMTIVAQAPKMSAHIEAMREKIATTLAVENGVISVKATTTESLGFAGRKEGIACHAIVLLEKH